MRANAFRARPRRRSLPKDDGQLVTDALMMALWRRGKPDALLRHSDRGSQYERAVPAPDGRQWRRLFGETIRQCLGQFGNGELLLFTEDRADRKENLPRDDARADVFHYVERFYNPVRRHSPIGYVSPVKFEEVGGNLTRRPRNRQQANQRCWQVNYINPYCIQTAASR